MFIFITNLLTWNSRERFNSQVPFCTATYLRERDCFIQGDSGGRVSMVGGDNIGHCEKNKFTWMITQTQLFESTNKKALWW